jgi:hypothetical protein
MYRTRTEGFVENNGKWAERARGFLFGHLILLALIGTVNIITFSMYDKCLKVEVQYNPPMTENQVRAAEYIIDNGIEDPTKLCSAVNGKQGQGQSKNKG